LSEALISTWVDPNFVPSFSTSNDGSTHSPSSAKRSDVTDKIMVSVVRRNLKRSPFFRQEAPTPTLDLHLESHEVVAGTYTNPAPWGRTQIVFTDAAIHLFDDEMWHQIRWDDIVGYETLDPAGDLAGVRLRTRDGIRFFGFPEHTDPTGSFEMRSILRWCSDRSWVQ
jgi:hypothetical protein